MSDKKFDLNRVAEVKLSYSSVPQRQKSQLISDLKLPLQSLLLKSLDSLGIKVKSIT